MVENPEHATDVLGMTFGSTRAAVGLRTLAGEFRMARAKVLTEKREFDGVLIKRNRTVVLW